MYRTLGKYGREFTWNMYTTNCIYQNHHYHFVLFNIKRPGHRLNIFSNKDLKGKKKKRAHILKAFPETMVIYVSKDK